MKISMTNIGLLPGVFDITSDANPPNDPLDIVDSDFNRRYLTAGTDNRFTFYLEPGTPTDINYVALGGHNFGTNRLGGFGGGILEVSVGTSIAPDLVGSVRFEPDTRNNVMMITFPTVIAPQRIEVSFLKDNADDALLLSNFQTGLTFDFQSEINNSEQMGYKRIWLQPTGKARSMIPGQGQPVIPETERHPNKMVLSIPNIQADDFNYLKNPNSNIYDFLQKLRLDTLWYCKEYDGSSANSPDNPRSSYLCFDTNLQMMANGNTRALNNMKLTFTAYTGI